MALLCSPAPACTDVFGSDDLLFSGGMDLDDLFSDDLMGALLNGPVMDLGCGLLPSVASDTPLLQQQLQSAGPCSSGDSHGGSTAGSTNSILSSGQLFQAPSHATTVMRLQVQRSAGPPTRKAGRPGPVRQMTPPKAPEELHVKAPAAPAVSHAPAPFPVASAQDELIAALLRSGSQSSDDDSDNGSDTDDAGMQDGQSKRSNKRKAPEIDWRSITDPSERRRQRRLAKNRMTAARSRERKKVQWADMEAKLARMNNDNKALKAMLQHLAQENSALRGQLEGMVQTGQAPGRLAGHGESATLMFIAILLLLCCALPAEQAMLLGSAAPMLLLVQQLLSQLPSNSSSSASSAGGKPPQLPLATALLRFLLSVKMLLARVSVRLRASVHNMLYRRHHYVGRRVLYRTATWAATSGTRLLAGSSLPPPPCVKQEPDDSLLPVFKQAHLDFPMFDAGSLFISGLP